MKIIFIVIDGLFDEPIPQFNGRTPLEVANVPTIRSLLLNSRIGVIDNRLDREVTSDIAVARLLGVKLEDIYETPRSILEVIAEGIPFIDGNLALHCNFSTIDTQTGSIIDRRAGRTLTRGEAKILEREIRSRIKLEKAEFVFKHIIDYVSVLVIRDPEVYLSTEITETDPWRPGEEKKLRPCKPLREDQGAYAACSHINEFTFKSINILDKHPVNIYRKVMGLYPANCIICRQPGNKLPRINYKFIDKYGLEGAAQARLPTERGIAKLIGLELLSPPIVEPFENLGAYYYERAVQVAESLKNYDFIYVHIDEADDAAHDKNPLKKKRTIEVIDEYFLRELIGLIRGRFDDVYMVITADHGTSSITGYHLNISTPVLVYNSKFQRNKPIEFNERINLEQADFYVKAEDFLHKVIGEIHRR